MAPAGQTIPLDQRPTNAARVQLKSTLGRAGNRIRLSLSAIDGLAKDPRPALIIVLRLRADGELQSAYLVHLIGNELGRVLRRLRVADASKAHDINHADISYDYEKVGVRFEPTPTGLLTALTAACGQNPGAYTTEKQRQLAELGYENGQFEAEALIQIEGPEHFSNLLLGLAPLKPHRLRVFDSRFGIRLPYQGTLFDDLEELRLTPPSLGPCEISVRGRGLDELRNALACGAEHRIVEHVQILAGGTADVGSDLGGVPLGTRKRTLLVGVRRDEACVDGKVFTTDQALTKAATDSNRYRRILLSRKRPCRLREKVE